MKVAIMGQDFSYDITSAARKLVSTEIQLAVKEAQ